MAIKNRDIVYVLRMRNEAKAALRSYRGDLQSAAQAAAAATQQAKEMAKQAKSLDAAIRKTGNSTQTIASNMTAATGAIRNANRELQRFSSAANSSSKVAAGMGRAVTSIQSAGTALRQLNTALAGFARAAEKTGVLAQKLASGASSINAATTALKAATSQATAFANAANQAGNAMNKIGNKKAGGGGSGGPFSGMLESVGKVRGAILGIGAAIASAFAVKGVFDLTDQFTAMQSQLKLVTKNTDQLTATYEALFRMAQNTRQSLDGTVNLYARISRATQSLGMNQKQTLELTDAINKSVAIFGGPAASAEAALFQLSQGFASGQLRGEELNSVLEQSPRLAQAIADGMGVAVGSLRTLAEQGKLTSEAVLKAIMSQKDVLNKEFGKIGVTVGQAFTVAQNSLLDYVGKVDQATKTSNTFAKSVINASNLLRDPALVRAGTSAMETFGKTLEAVVSGAVYLAKNLDILKTAFIGLALYAGRGALASVVTFLISAVSGAIALRGAVNGVNLALLATAARLRVIQFLMSSTGIGLAIVAIGTAIGYWVTRTEDTTRASDNLADAVRKVKDEYAGAAEQAANLSKEARNAAILAAQQLADTAAPKLKSQRQDLSMKMGGYQFFKDGVSDEGFKKLNDEAQSFIRQLVAGEGDVQGFIDKITEMAVADPTLTNLVTKMKEWASETANTEATLKKAQATLKYFNGTANAAEKALAGFGDQVQKTDENIQNATIVASAYAEAMKKLTDMTAKGKVRNQALEDISKATTAYNTALKNLNTLQKQGEISSSEYFAEVNRLALAFRTAKDDAGGLTDALKSLKEYTDATNLSGIFNSQQRAIAEARVEYEKLKKEIQDSVDTNPEAKKNALANLDASFRQRLANEEGQKRYDAAKSMSETLRGLENENRLIGLNTAQRQRLTAVMQAEASLRQSGLGIDDQRYMLEEFTKSYDKLIQVQNQGQFAEKIGEQVKALKAQALMAGVAGDQQDRLNQLIEFEAQARDAGLTDVDKWRKQYIAALDEVKAAQEKVNQNFGLGFGEGLREFAKEATNVRNQAKELGSGIATDVSSALKTGLKTGKFDIKELFSNIGGRFIDMAVDNFVGNIAKSLGGMFDNGTENNPVAKAQAIVAAQQDAYMMTVQGVQGAGTNFVQQLQLTFDGIVQALAQYKNTMGTNPTGVTPTGSMAQARALDRASVPGYSADTAQTVRQLKTDIISEVIKAKADTASINSAIRSAGGGSFSTVGNFNARGAQNVDQRLVQIMQEASRRSGFDVEAYSGYRPGDKRFHGKGMAMDVGILGPDGQRLPNYQNGSSFRQYEQLAQQARMVQQEMYPELSEKFRWGGYFSGGKGKYGANDAMHFDLGGKGPNGMMGGGSWAGGLNAQQRQYFPDATSVGMNMQQLQQNITQVGQAAQQASTATTTLNTAYSTTGTNAQTAGTAVTQLSQNAQQAANTMQSAGANMRGAGQAAATAGQGATTATSGLSGVSQGFGALLGPLSQVIPGLGQFGSAIMALLSNLGSIGGAKGSGGLGDFFGLFFADGGVMSSRGKMPLKTYSKGGVAKSPQVAVFGEGKQNEAYVPLPDGKSIPVTMQGGGGGAGLSMGDININVHSKGSSGDPAKDAMNNKDMANQVGIAVDQRMSEWVANQMRPGGIFYTG